MSERDELSFQQLFLEQILAKYPRKADAIDDLIELLHSSKDPVYRRLRGDTLLTPDEMKALCLRYQISLDALIFGKSDQVVFSFNPFERPVRSFEDYLERYLTDLEAIKNLPNLHIFYASAEIPIFTYMLFPEVIAFKLFVWGRTTWHFDFLKTRKFETSLLTPSLEALCERLLALYNLPPSTELLSVNVVDNTLNQVENAFLAGHFADPAEAIMLCDRLESWAQHMKAQSMIGRKFSRKGGPSAPVGEFRLYHNEMLHTNNTVLVKSSAMRGVYTTFSNPNVLKTTDPKVSDHIEEWFKMMVEQANPITGGSERTRNWFFDSMARRVGAVRRRIEIGIDDRAALPR